MYNSVCIMVLICRSVGVKSRDELREVTSNSPGYGRLLAAENSLTQLVDSVFNNDHNNN